MGGDRNTVQRAGKIYSNSAGLTFSNNPSQIPSTPGNRTAYRNYEQGAKEHLFLQTFFFGKGEFYFYLLFI